MMMCCELHNIPKDLSYSAKSAVYSSKSNDDDNKHKCCEYLNSTADDHIMSKFFASHDDSLLMNPEYVDINFPIVSPPLITNPNP
jgi:hypothetical protein